MFGRRKQTPRVTIGDECDAYLSGRSWALYEDASYPVPPWAHLNRLARGSIGDLVDLASQPGRAPSSDNDMSWEFALHLLAQQLLADGPDADELRTLQASVLIPLEEVLGDGVPLELVELDVSPRVFFRLVLARLAEPVRRDRDTE